jgi:hypothetical protein
VGVSEEELAAGKGKDGPWTNIYRSDPDLAGVIVQQFPDGDDNFTFEERDGKHPCMILYGFWDDRFRQMHYTPTGEVTSEFWFKIDESTKWIWNNVDFTQGSDPWFKTHQDPRVRWGGAPKAEKPNKTSLLTPDPLPVPAVMTATTSTPCSTLAPGQA